MGNIPCPTVPSGDVAHVERPIFRGIFQGPLATLRARPQQMRRWKLMEFSDW